MLKVFFFHCPKAGGTSISKALEEATPRELVAPLIENDLVGHNAKSGYDCFRGYHLYTGHYGKDIFDSVEDGHIAITNFRHPASRIVSLYNYFRDQVSISAEMLQEERYFALRFAKENDFESFVQCDDPRVTVYTRNQHVRQLTQSPWENSGGDLNQAQRLVLNMPCYYVCEYPELSVAWLSEKLGVRTISYHNKTKVTNQAIKLNVLGKGVIQKICRDNAEDLRLYRLAVASFLLSPTEREAAEALGH
jgi:hypothetical protein